MTISQIDAATGLGGLGGAVVHGLISAGLAEDVVNGLFIGAESQHPFALTNLGRELLSVIEVATVDA